MATRALRTKADPRSIDKISPFALSLSKGFDKLSPNGIPIPLNANPYKAD
jgi:hypothetical protein